MLVAPGPLLLGGIVAIPDSRNDRDYRSWEEDSLAPGETRRKVTALIDPSQYPVDVSFSEGTAEVKSPYGELTSLASGSETDAVLYTVPAGKKAFLQRAEFSGENIATYRVKVNGATIARTRTWWTGDLRGAMIWQQANQKGLPLVAADVLKITVIHSRPLAADFEARLLIVEEDV